MTIDGRKECLIIGLTGPIAAGCTYVARKLEGMARLTSQNRKWIDDMLGKVEQEIIDNSQNGESDKEKLINQVKENMRFRNCLYALKRSQPLRFKRISMSEVIVQICFQNLNAASLWAGENRYRKAIIQRMQQDLPIVKNALDMIKDDWTKLKQDDYVKIDDALGTVKKVTSFIKEKEIEALKAGSERVFVLQQLANNIRNNGNPFVTQGTTTTSTLQMIAAEAANLLEFFRHRSDQKARCNFILDAIRNPAEANYFRERYGQFFLLSIHASEHTRKERFVKANSNLDPQEAAAIFGVVDEQDRGEKTYQPKSLHVQGVSECSHIADIAISNDHEGDDGNEELKRKFVRFLALIVEPGCTQPTPEETMMSLAYSLSLRSTCICRQVGAVITDKEGYILGQGWNDTGHGQIGCGLLTIRDYQNIKEGSILEPYAEVIPQFNLQSYELHHSICFKDKMSELELRKKYTPGMQQTPSTLAIKRLEFCRALHAEENALLQAARVGGMGVKGGTIYTTTFPCELCAKKIRQAGISRIVFTEPYPGSISENIFLKDGASPPAVQQFEGVKFNAYARLFKPRFNKKEQQLASIR